MIQLDFDLSDTWSLLVLVLAIVLLPLQLWLLLKRVEIRSASRLRLKICLNVLLWLSLIAFILQPYFSWPMRSLTGIVAGSEVPRNAIESLRDSLPNSELLPPISLRKKVPDTLVLFGQQIPQSVFAGLQLSHRRPILKWIPYFSPDELRRLNWKGVLDHGAMQAIHGSIESSKKQVLKVSFGANVLDSVILNPGMNDFRIDFPAFAQGRTAVILDLAGEPVDTLRFFARQVKPLAVRFKLESPDFETRNLAAWLGKNGNAVTYDALISRDLKASVEINRAEVPELFVTTPGNAKDPAIRKAVSGGASILFLGFEDPATQLSLINTALGTHFKVRKISNESIVDVSAGLTALPFGFAASPGQLEIPGFPVAVEKRTGKVAVSLLNETFPMQLAGDSMGYQKVWGQILAYLRPVQENGIGIVAPVIAGSQNQIELNNVKPGGNLLKWGADTLFTAPSPFNENAKNGALIPATSGWISLGDSLNAEVFVEETSDFAGTSQVRDFVNAYENQLSGLKGDRENLKGVTARLPDWFWLALLITCFAALWIEAKFS
ncbi:hypothetical protein [Dyadobacter aurulentus]|uniref:hypothetical protein n=1 Tax=Dyadobacter sp. UC 10 TaxID=2605428 RepID=UPI0011F1C792|nr:hypothetical protein [Dyadobacter sp. UC 10]KAA0992492.1 hypothetical protein FXO21_21135 [Dyadobacter sp. UC 10]